MATTLLDGVSYISDKLFILRYLPFVSSLHTYFHYKVYKFHTITLVLWMACIVLKIMLK